jgi:hypothetical protein
MKRHFAPAVGVMLAISACLLLPAPQAGAQTAGALPGAGAPGTAFFNDPFSFYYAVYLPNQQLQAMRPTPLDSVNEAMITRQYYTQANRRALYDPISPYSETYDPLRPFSSHQERIARPYRFTRSPSNSDGMGPSLYFNRSSQYYPDLAGRATRRRNANVYSGRGAGRAMGGGGGMGGMGGGGGMGGMGMF